MKSYLIFGVLALAALIFLAFQFPDNEVPTISSQTEDCITCHAEMHPGIVQSWLNGRHSKMIMAEALKKGDLEKRVSVTEVDASLQNVVVGCYECHSLNTDKHADSFEHNGYKINVVVSPNDCATCHAEEVEQYSKNIMSQAYANLMDNPLYQDLKKSITGEMEFKDGDLHINCCNEETDAVACLYCHGTKLVVTGTEKRETDFGEMEFPVISGWPNQGVGRINTDGSKGACTACHPRHDFSIETARQPYTCGQCHKGPDVPAYKVYNASKHGNIYNSHKSEFDFSAVPWKVGRDFTVPTCATCHASLIVGEGDNVIAKRTHQFNDRLAWRLFGVPYAHPHPISPKTNIMKNSLGLPLAVELNSEPVSEFLIDAEEQEIRDARMKAVCKACHSTNWVEGHFNRIENTIKTTNKLTLTATNMMTEIWDKGYAQGLPHNKNIFDESIERDWTTIWLFYANSIRLATAMGGGGDYGVFANGRYQLTNKLNYMKQYLDTQNKLKEK